MRTLVGRYFPLLVLLMIASFMFVIYFESLQTLKRQTVGFLNGQMSHILPLVSSSVQTKQDKQYLLTGDELDQELTPLHTSESPKRVKATKKREIPNLDLVNNSSKPSDNTDSMILKQANGLLVFGQPVGCEPLDPQVLLYNRVPKTGSTTTNNLMNDMGHLMNYSFYSGELFFFANQVYLAA